MGKGTQEDKGKAQKNIGIERADDKAARKHKAGRKQKLKAPEPVAADQIKILINHYFPEFNKDLGQLPDPRLTERIIYTKEHLLYLGLCMFLFHCGSRSQLESKRLTMEFFLTTVLLNRPGVTPCTHNFSQFFIW